jgi:hypothetical protein
MPTTRKPTHRRPTRRITARAVDIFDAMENLAARCSCTDVNHKCDACEEWWRKNDELMGELKLRPWEFPAYGDYEDPNKTGVRGRYLALKAASDARKQKA